MNRSPEAQLRNSVTAAILFPAPQSLTNWDKLWGCLSRAFGCDNLRLLSEGTHSALQRISPLRASYVGRGSKVSPIRRFDSYEPKFQ